MTATPCIPAAYVGELSLIELQAELVLAASRLLGTRVEPSIRSKDLYICRECAGRGRDRHLVSHVPIVADGTEQPCAAGAVAQLLLAIAHREADQVSHPTRKEPVQETCSGEPAARVARESRPYLLPRPWRTAGALYAEPWSLTAEGEVVDAQERTIVHPEGSTLPPELEEQTLHRLAVCVNFCEGVPTSALVRELVARATGGAR